MNAKDRKALERADRLTKELMDRDWLEQGVSQEELDQSRLLTQQWNAALDNGCSMEDILAQWDSKPSEKIEPREEPAPATQAAKLSS